MATNVKRRAGEPGHDLHGKSYVALGYRPVAPLEFWV